MSSANKWFEGLSNDYRQTIIETIYELIADFKESDKITDLKNSHYNKIEKVNEELMNKNKELNEMVSIISTMNNIKDELKHDLRSITTSLTPSKIGKFAELLTIELLCKNFSSAVVNDVSNVYGQGDIYFELDGIRCMVESKAQTNDSLRKNPTETVGRFKTDLINAINDDKVDFGVFVAQRSSNIPHKGSLCFETINTNKGKALAIYVADTFNNPERLITSMEVALDVVKNFYINSDNDMSKLVYKLQQMSGRIDTLKQGLKERKKSVITLQNYIIKDEELYNYLIEEFRNITNTKTDNVLETKIIDTYNTIFINKGKVTQSLLEEECKKVGITIRNIRDCGGIRVIRQKAITNIT